ncbi:hypothetical protein [Trueperella bialowiezensis]|uniref:hypothetical protein n=1 Tax=Trueperella bialowiezensis TaxID=312285 RepID=UPI000F844CC9|nr:hypothetical protein [Trueperella bialowiezensis]
MVALGFRAQPNQARISHAALFLLTLLSLTLFVWSIGATVASYQGQDARGSQRAPVIATDSEPTSHIAFVLDRLSGASLQFTVAYVIPKDITAAPPPGLEEWPQPGEVYLSPALLKAGKGEGIETRYGELAGEISPGGLTTENELFAYVNPADRPTLDERFQPVSHFGASRPALTGSLLDRPPISQPLQAIFLILGIPLILLVRSTLKMGLYHRRRESTVLFGLGAKRLELILWHLGKVVAPFIGWACLAIIGLAILCTFGLRIPNINFVISADDFQAGLFPFVITALLVSVVFSFVWLAVSLKPLDTKVTTRPSSIAESYSPKRARIGAIAAPLTIVVATIGADQKNTLAFFAFIALVVITIITTSDTIGALLLYCARSLRQRAKHREDPETLVASATLESRSSSVNRIAVTTLMALLSAVVIQTVLGIFAQADQTAKATFTKFNNSVLVLSLFPEMPEKHIAQLVDAVDDSQSAHALLLSTRFDPSTEQEKLEIALNDPTDRALLDNEIAREYVSMRQQKIGDDSDSIKTLTIKEALQLRNTDASIPAEEIHPEWELVFISHTPGTLDIAKVKQIAFGSIAPLPFMQIPEESWIVAQTQSIARNDWVELFVLGALGLLALSLVVFIVDESNDGLRRLAQMKTVSGRPIHVNKISFIRIGLPVGLGAAAGLLLASIFSISLVLLYGESLNLFTRTLPAIFIALALLFSALWVVSARNLRSLVKGTQ